MIEQRFKLTEFLNPDRLNAFLIVRQRLINAGIPIKGLFFFQGVERGTLTEFIDTARNEVVYQWSELHDKKFKYEDYKQDVISDLQHDQ